MKRQRISFNTKRHEDIDSDAIHDSIMSCFKSVPISVALQKLQLLLEDHPHRRKFLGSRNMTSSFTFVLYWIFYVKGIFNFDDYVESVSESNLSNSIVEYLQQSQSNECIVKNIVCYLFSLQDNCIQIVSKQTKAIRILHQICLPTIFEIDDEKEYVEISPQDMYRIQIINSWIKLSGNISNVQKFLTFQLIALMRCIIVVNEHDNNFQPDEIREVYGENIITFTLESALRDNNSIFDYRALSKISYMSSPNCRPIILEVLRVPTASIGTNQEHVNSLTEHIFRLANDMTHMALEQSEGKFFLRALCLVECCGGRLAVERWLAQVCSTEDPNPPPADPCTEVGDTSSHSSENYKFLRNSTDFSFICWSLCESIPYHHAEVLRSLSSFIHKRRRMHVESADAYIQQSRIQLRKYDYAKQLGQSTNNIQTSAKIDFSVDQLESWVSTHKKTGQLPVNFTANICAMHGSKAYELVINCLSSKQFNRASANSLVLAMARAKPPLCPESVADAFINRSKSSEIIDQVDNGLKFVNASVNINIFKPLYETQKMAFTELIEVCESITSFNWIISSVSSSTHLDSTACSKKTSLNVHDFTYIVGKSWMIHCNKYLFASEELLTCAHASDPPHMKIDYRARVLGCLALLIYNICVMLSSRLQTECNLLGILNMGKDVCAVVNTNRSLLSAVASIVKNELSKKVQSTLDAVALCDSRMTLGLLLTCLDEQVYFKLACSLLCGH